ncbi:MAG: C_GCAxxG_C_C family protein [Oscillospiraceae bacterium]|nr:C_GCAxxG_C_C family protein [Oscillospiraceae bacterium]
MINYGERAAELFSMGYNCAQSVAGAFAERFDIPLETMVKLASSFGGGMAGTRGVCGAVSGMLCALGLAKGYSDPAAKEEKQAHYALCRKAMDEFAEENGSVICSELLAAQRDAGEKKRPCRELCRLAAEIAAKYVD